MGCGYAVSQTTLLLMKRLNRPNVVFFVSKGNPLDFFYFYSRFQLAICLPFRRGDSGSRKWSEKVSAKTFLFCEEKSY